MTGADLANLVNEAALLATRREADAVYLQDFENAVERVTAGLHRKNRILSQQERTRFACHELGHGLLSLELPGTDPVQKVSIIPRSVVDEAFERTCSIICARYDQLNRAARQLLKQETMDETELRGLFDIREKKTATGEARRRLTGGSGGKAV